MDKLMIDLRDGDLGWVWAVQFSIEFSIRSENFRSFSAFRKWAFDPEFGLELEQKVYLPKRIEPSFVGIFWPHAALRVLGLDVACGFCIRPPIKT